LRFWFRIAPFDLRYGNRRGTEEVLKIRFPIPFRTGSAAVEIECRSAVFGICMACEMRFGESDHARHAGCAGELVPNRTDRLEAEILDDALKQIAQ